jgi:EAL and modified HD-GYP domain-containing signal transduction protein
MASISPRQISASELFTMGMFSLIDAIVDQPMHQVMDELPLSDSIKRALTLRKGSLCAYLVLVETYEKGDWNHVQQVSALMDLPESRLPELYHQACQWSNTLLDDKKANDSDHPSISTHS